MFTLVTESTAPLSLRGFVQIAPCDLVQRFGPPGPGSVDRKVTGSYHFQDHRKRSLRIYDWKATTIYDGRTEAGTLRPEDFWKSSLPQEFSVAATATVNLVSFARWLGAVGFRSTWA
jgi:hypothetical protein